MRAITALLAVGALFTASCEREPKLSTERLPISVNYDREFTEAAELAGIRESDRAMVVPSETGRAPARFVSVVRAPDRQHFERLQSATPRELLAYVEQHPEDAARYRRLCARGTLVSSSEGYRGHLAYSGESVRGRHRLGVFKNGCRWVLLVK